MGGWVGASNPPPLPPTSTQQQVQAVEEPLPKGSLMSWPRSHMLPAQKVVTRVPITFGGRAKGLGQGGGRVGVGTRGSGQGPWCKPSLPKLEAASV